ncbi:MAG: hypothetical protein JWN44_319 [Myxococcales bacterium]|nr:hypothetical protein [Myxococcales bacterium]
MRHAQQPVVAVVVDPEPARDAPRCWVCSAIVGKDEPTIAPTVCARCYEALVAWWR